MKRWRDRIVNIERWQSGKNFEARRQFNRALRAGKASTYIPSSLSPEDREIQETVMMMWAFRA